MAIEGPLKELNIQDVLQLLSLANKTGVLTVRSDRLNDEAIVHFNKGEIVFAVRRRSTRRLGQLLIRAGKLTQRELHAALEVQRADPTRRLAEILLDMGTIGEQELERQLRFQMEETIYELMGWEEGYFKFEERTEIAMQRLIAAIRVESLLMEGARRSDEWTRLEAKVPGPESVPVLAPPEERDAEPLELRTEEWEVLAEIDGERDIRQLAADLARSAFDVAKTVFGLVNAGIVQVHDRHSRFPEEQLRHSITEVNRLLADGSIEEAQKLALDLESSYPDRSEFALLVGRTLFSQSRLRAATEAFSRAVALDPLSAEAHYQLGFSALKTGDFERAGKAWETYVRLSPNGEQRQLVTNALSAVKTLAHFLNKAKSREQ
jgi:tetratricopeptide (TPR) repeat protein